MGKYEWLTKLLLGLAAVAGRLLLRYLDRREKREEELRRKEQEREFIKELDETLHPEHKRKGHHAGK